MGVIRTLNNPGLLLAPICKWIIFHHPLEEHLPWSSLLANLVTRCVSVAGNRLSDTDQDFCSKILGLFLRYSAVKQVRDHDWKWILKAELDALEL
jgi:hypothetical protein